MRHAMLGALAATLVLATPIVAQDYPSQPIHLIVSYSPGGVLDTTARTLAPYLEEELGQPIVIDNRPGGGGAIGVATAAGATPDGYTLLIATSAESANAPALRDDLPYDMETDFIPITFVNDTPIVVIASAESGFQSMDEVFDAARERQVSYGTPGVGSSHHLLGEAIGFEGGIELLHIAYQGAAPAATAVASGEVDLGIASIAAALPHIESGNATPLAVASADRTEVLADTPTLTELGLDVTTSVWVGLFAPAGTPDEVVQRLNDAAHKALARSEVIERMATTGAVPLPSTPDELTERRRSETEWSAQIVERAGIQPE